MFVISLILSFKNHIISTIRFSALKETLNRKPVKIIETEKRSVLFGQNVFNKYAMQQY
jgi:glutamine synthetase